MKTRGHVFFSFAIFFLGTLALASTSTLSANEVPPAGTYTVEAPAFQVGDFWKYRYLNKKGGFAQSVTEVNDNEVRLSSGGRTILFSREGNVVSGYGPVTGKLVTYDPAVPRLRFPLWVGKKWIVSYTARSEDWSEQGTLEGRVVSRERIEVPAGSFDALRIELRFSTGTQELCWYAELVKRFIKCEFTDPGRAYELETFRIGPLLGVERVK
jgi:hypothetical protein